MPEEAAYYIRQVYKAFGCLADNFRSAKTGDNFWPKRVVMQNVSIIGTSYPFLRSPTTGPELFLSGLTHLLKCREADFLMTTCTDGVPASEEITKQAISLADIAIKCSHLDVFGDRYVTVTGPGLIEHDVRNANTPEDVPGVMRRRTDHFWIDMEVLEGLVGFGTGQIRRPGAVLQLFEEGQLHKKYNHQVKTPSSVCHGRGNTEE